MSDEIVTGDVPPMETLQALDDYRQSPYATIAVLRGRIVSLEHIYTEAESELKEANQRIEELQSMPVRVALRNMTKRAETAEADARALAHITNRLQPVIDEQITTEEYDLIMKYLVSK